MTNIYLQNLARIIREGRKLPDRVSNATFTKIPLLKRMNIERKGKQGYSSMVYLKDYIKELMKKENRYPCSFEEILNLWLKDHNNTLINRKYDLSNQFSPKISGRFCETSSTVLYSTR